MSSPLLHSVSVSSAHKSHQLNVLMFGSCPNSRVHVFYCSASTARDELPKEVAPLQPSKEEPHLEFLIAAFLGAPSEVQRKESGRAVRAAAGKPFGNCHQRRRRVEWARVAHPARVGKIALRSLWFPICQSCTKKENEVIL